MNMLKNLVAAIRGLFTGPDRKADWKRDAQIVVLEGIASGEKKISLRILADRLGFKRPRSRRSQREAIKFAARNGFRSSRLDNPKHVVIKMDPVCAPAV